MPPQDRKGRAFSPAGLPATGGLIWKQGYVSVNRNYLALFDNKENFSRWSQFLRYHLNVKTYDEYKDKPGTSGKKRIEKQQRVVSTKLTELQYYAIRKRAGEAGLRVSEYVRQAVVSAEVIPRLNRQDADTIRKLAGKPTTSTNWRTERMPEVSHWWRWNW